MRFFAFLAPAGKPHDSSRSAESHRVAPVSKKRYHGIEESRVVPSPDRCRLRGTDRPHFVTRSLDQSFATALIKLTAITMSARICFTTSTGRLFPSKVDEFCSRAGRSRRFPRPSRPCWCRQCNQSGCDGPRTTPGRYSQRTTTFKCNSNCGTGRRRFLGIEGPGHRYQNQREELGPASEIRAGYAVCRAGPCVHRDDNYSGLRRKFFTLACKNS
jgi:hypothetical protein